MTVLLVEPGNLSVRKIGRAPASGAALEHLLTQSPLVQSAMEKFSRKLVTARADPSINSRHGNKKFITARRYMYVHIHLFSLLVPI